MKKQTKLNEAKLPVKIGDVLYLGKRKGKVTKVMSDMANVDFGKGDVYGITFSRIKGDKIDEGNAPDGYHYMPNGELMKDEDHITEGRPIPMDTPNEFAYLDFKKHAIKNQTDFKKDLEKANGDGGRMFLIASAIWYKWARQYNKEFTHIKDKNKFGRALLVLMMKDNLIIKKGNKLTDLK